MSYDGEDGTVDQSQWEELKWRRDQMAKWSAGGQPPSDGMPSEPSEEAKKAACEAFVDVGQRVSAYLKMQMAEALRAAYAAERGVSLNG